MGDPHQQFQHSASNLRERDMDRETWLRSKRSSKWTIVGNEPILLAEREPSMTIADCRVKDELVTKYENIAREALEGQSKAEERELLIKRELDEAVAAKAAADLRLSLVEAALVNSVEQLNALEDEMEGKIRDAVVEGTTMFVERQVEFEEKLNEATADFINLSVENSRLVAEISAKDKTIEDLNRQRCMAESELDEIVMRLDGIEKENAFLRYEFQLMEKELAMRNEPLEYCNQLAEGLHKKHLQGLNKVAKLEAECQKLRVQSQKRVIQSAMTRIPNSRKSHVMESMRMLEDENKMLKEVILMKDSELEKERDGGSSGGQYLKMPRYEFDVCKDCSSSASWANALILELENFRKEGLQSTLSHGSERSPKPSPEPKLLGAEKLVVVPLEIAPSSKGKSSSSLTKSSVDWLQVVWDAITEQRRISERDFEDLLLDVGIALVFSYSCKNTRQMRQCGTSGKYDIGGLLPWKARLTTKMGNGDKIETTETAKTELEERLDNAQQEIYQMNDEAVRLKESKRLLEDQIEHQKLVNQDLETQLAVTRVELNEVMQQYYSLEVELEDQNHRCEELESTCIELELQLGSVATEPSDYDGVIQGPITIPQDGGEEKFAACKDTVVDITKQPKTPPSLLKASSSGRASSDRSTVIASRRTNNRPSLRDRMLADGFAELEAAVVPHSTEIPSRRSDDALFISGAAIRTLEMIQKYSAETAAGPPATATSPRKRNGAAGFGFVRKLMIKSNGDRQGAKPINCEIGAPIEPFPNVVIIKIVIVFGGETDDLQVQNLDRRRCDALGNLRVLPDEVICSILENLSARDLCRPSCVSSVMYILCNEGPLWMSLCLKCANGLLQYKESWKRTTLHLGNVPLEKIYFCQKPLQFPGDPLCDLIPIHLDVFRGDPSLLKQFLQSYKLPLLRPIMHNELEEDGKYRRLSYCAMCYCILHEENVLGAVFSIWKELWQAQSGEEVEQTVWGDLNSYPC